MTEHTKEPWRIEPATKKDNWRIIGANGQVVSTFSGNMDMENARRIVACVNACAGLTTDYLETVGLPEFAGKTLCADLAQQEIGRVTAQRDQLLAALEGFDKAMEEASDWPDTSSDRAALLRAVYSARRAIAAVKGDRSDNTL